MFPYSCSWAPWPVRTVQSVASGKYSISGSRSSIIVVTTWDVDILAVCNGTKREGTSAVPRRRWLHLWMIPGRSTHDSRSPPSTAKDMCSEPAGKRRARHHWAPPIACLSIIQRVGDTEQLHWSILRQTRQIIDRSSKDLAYPERTHPIFMNRSSYFRQGESVYEGT